MARITVNGREITFPPEDPTMGEMADAENYFGVEWANPERSGMRITAAFMWIALKRADPTVTVDDIRNLDPSVLEQLAGDDAGPPAETETSKTESSGPSDTSSENGSTESWEDGPSRIGLPGSDTTSIYDQATSPS